MIPGILTQEIVASGGGGAMSMVRFDNSIASTGLNVASQSVTDSRLVSVSMFFRISNTSIQQKLFALGDSSGNQLNEMFSKYVHVGDVGFDFTNTGGGALFESVINGTPLISGHIHHLLFSVDLNHAAGSKIANAVIDGTLYALDAGQTTDGDAAFSAGFNGAEFGLPDLAANLGGADVIDFQSVWIAHGQYVDPSDVGLFRNATTGEPMDLGADGSGPTGTAPTYYFTGNAATFATNLGSGAQPTLTGSLTDA